MARLIPSQPHDADTARSERYAVIGYGNQGRAQALNMRDQGLQVVVGLRAGSPRAEQVQSDELVSAPILEAVDQATVIMALVPDEEMGHLGDLVGPALRPGQLVTFAHGYALTFDTWTLPTTVDSGVVSPKGAGRWVRARFEQGSGLPALVAVHNDATGRCLDRLRALAWGIGSARAGMLETTVREETVSDLFGEQAVLCGGIPALIRAGFETLVSAGYDPDIAYFETVYEAKLIVDLLLEQGEAGMRKAISNTAEFGGQLAADRLVTGETRKQMSAILAEIESGAFAQQWNQEAEKGAPNLLENRAKLNKQMEESRTAIFGRFPMLRP